MSMKIMHFIGMVCISVFCMACASNNIKIKEDSEPAELIQMAQTASDRNRYKESLQYYQAILDRYPTHIDAVCAAEYEIGFIHYKQKKYEIARAELNALLSRYETPDAELLPPQFKKLADIVLKKITEKAKK